ncbi:MAG: glycosyltransferase 87 family protein [Thaumarchaeota archaeon]|nr:glycosyltransferase 87 family protein [Nitrososphaerota archaeon]
MNDQQYATAMLAATIAFLISALIHFPLQNSPVYYSDFVYSFWGRAGILTGIPYVNYMFEYPPISGLVLWAGAWGSHGSEFVFITIEFTILLAFMLFTTHVVYQFLKYLGLNYNRQLLFSIFVPSVIFYGAYNFDLIQAFFTVFCLYLFVARRRIWLSAFVLGLAVATKISPAILLPLFLQELGNTKSRVTFTGIAAGVVGAFNLPFAAANFNTWLQGYLYVKGWGLEDSFLVWLFPNTNSWVLAKDISLALVGGSALLIYTYFRSRPLLTRAFMAMVAFTLFSYIASPQMNVDLLPLFALVPLIPLSLFYLLEISNAAIILSWFEFPNPTLPGVAQTFALIRQIYLAFILGLLGFSRKEVNT